MRLKRVLALLTASVVCISMLTGCNNNTNTDPDQGKEPVDYEAFVTEFTAEDDAFYTDLLGGKAADTIMTADSLPVDVATYSYWLAYYLCSFEDSVNSSGISDTEVEIDWDAPWDETNNIDDIMKEYAGSSAIYYAVIQKIADDYGITLDDADLAVVAEDRMDAIRSVGETLWEQYVSGGYITESLYDDAAKEEWIMEKGAEVYLQQLAGIGSTDAGYNRISTLTALYEKTRDTVFGEGGEKAPTQEQLDAFVDENDLVCVKFIYLASYDESYNEVDRADDAVEILEDIQNSDDPAAAFTKHLEEDGEADFSLYPNGYIASTSDFSADILSKVQAVEEGAVCEEVFSDDYGWYIMQRCPMDQQQLGKSYRESAMNDLLDEYLTDIETETTELYDNLDVTTYYNKIMDAQNGVYAAGSVGETDDGSEDTEEPAETDPAEDQTSSEEPAETEVPEEDPEVNEEEPAETPAEDEDTDTEEADQSASSEEPEDEQPAESDEPAETADTDDSAEHDIDSDFSVDKVQPEE